MLERLTKSKITNYSIFLRDGYLFSYFEYMGDDYDADMAAMGADPATQRWWELCVPCQERLATAAEGEQWAPAVEVFHLD